MAAIKGGIATCAKLLAWPRSRQESRLISSWTRRDRKSLLNQRTASNKFIISALLRAQLTTEPRKDVRGVKDTTALFSQEPKMGMIFDSPRNGELDGRPRACSWNCGLSQRPNLNAIAFPFTETKRGTFRTRAFLTIVLTSRASVCGETSPPSPTLRWIR